MRHRYGVEVATKAVGSGDVNSAGSRALCSLRAAAPVVRVVPGQEETTLMRRLVLGVGAALIAAAVSRGVAQSDDRALGDQAKTALLFHK